MLQHLKQERHRVPGGQYREVRGTAQSRCAVDTPIPVFIMNTLDLWTPVSSGVPA